MSKQQRQKPSRRHITTRHVNRLTLDEPVPTPITDEGIPFAWIDTTTIVNHATDRYDARRRELHVGGRTFSHVSEHGEAWVYRYDR